MPTRAMITGHRPPRIGGYKTPNPTEQWVRTAIRDLLTGLLAEYPDLEGISGMALGTDTIFAEECSRLGIPFIAAVPFQGQENRWPEESQNKYRQMLKRAAKVVVVDEIAAYHSDHFGGKMACRNKWMLDHSQIVIAVWDGSEGGTGNTMGMVRRRGDHRLFWAHPVQRVVTEEAAREAESEVDVLTLFGEDA